MIRVCRVLKIRLMACKTIYRRARKSPINVTLGAFNRHMRSGQGETRTIVIKRRGLPHTFGVTLRAGM